MKNNVVKKNFIFQSLYQLLIFGIPLIISPYLTRILGADELGIYSFTYSITSYFVILSNLGVQKYGTRIIATTKDNEEELRESFWGVFKVHIFFSLVSLILFILFVLIWGSDYKTIYFIQTLYLLSALFDITWLFYGLENFGSVVVKNALVKVVNLVLIFVLVKSSSDLYIYTLIMSVSLLLGNIVLIRQAIKLVRYKKTKLIDLRKHLKPLFILSISVIAVSLYTIFDKTLLGILTSKSDVAFYDYSDKIISVPKQIIAVTGTVLFPRVSMLISQNKCDEVKSIFNRSLLVTYFIGFGSLFGIVAVSDVFSIVYFGNSFAICGNIIMYLSPVILIIGIGDIVRNIYLIPHQMDKEYTICLIINAIVNLILTLTLIPVIGVYGAAIGTIVAELTGLVLEIFFVRKYIVFKSLFFNMIPFLLSGFCMFISLLFLKNKILVEATIKNLFILVVIGAFVYICLTFISLFILRFNKMKRNYD